MPVIPALSLLAAIVSTAIAIRVTRTIQLLDLYGDDVFAAAVADVVARGLDDVGAVASGP